VWADDVELYDSGLVTSSTATKTVRVGVAGRNTLRLVITDGATGLTNDVADWANPTLVCS
jgi:alpha-galactosidase